ncbi:MAG: hypothetical protein AAF351_10050 [Pseudomonadota bacterium]
MADDIFVPAQQPTIQDAINAAVAGDVVRVSAGTYFENINFAGKDITVEAVDGADVTIIDGGANGTSVVTIASGETRAAVLSGFTIRNGVSNRGGGIDISSSSPTIINNRIDANTACSGSGIFVQVSAALFQDNVISNNSTNGCSFGRGGGILVNENGNVEIVSNQLFGNEHRYGGGIFLANSGVTIIRGNVIRDNTVTIQGGGIAMTGVSNAYVEQNLIVGNAAFEGGGMVYLVPQGQTGPEIVGNTIAGNTAENDGFGVNGSGILSHGYQAGVRVTSNIVMAAPGEVAIDCLVSPNGQPIFESNLVFSASGDEYGSACTDQSGVNGNVSGDPGFANVQAGDYRIMSTSAAVDNGASETTVLQEDILGNPREVDANGDLISRNDIGAYEAQLPSADPSYLLVQGVNGTTVQLYASSSGDLDGFVSSYEWTQESGSLVTIQSPQSDSAYFYVPPLAGSVVIRLNVEDDTGFSNSSTINVQAGANPFFDKSILGQGGVWFDPRKTQAVETTDLPADVVESTDSLSVNERSGGGAMGVILMLLLGVISAVSYAGRGAPMRRSRGFGKSILD